MTNRQPNYLPTQSEIAAACREIQATWTPEDERRHRKGSPALDYVEVKRLKTGRTEPNAMNAVHAFMLQGSDSGR